MKMDNLIAQRSATYMSMATFWRGELQGRRKVDRNLNIVNPPPSPPPLPPASHKFAEFAHMSLGSRSVVVCEKAKRNENDEDFLSHCHCFAHHKTAAAAPNDDATPLRLTPTWPRLKFSLCVLSSQTTQHVARRGKSLHLCT